jgi:O-acetyl-ADP-ribose deacetylase (regulator of RNase III)
MVTQIDKNILTVERGIIGHQVNCQKAMGRGLAGEIAKKWHIALIDYLNACRAGKHLGDISAVEVQENLFVAHLFGQEFYGADGKQYTDYSSLELCLVELQRLSEEIQEPIYLPYGLGCGLGGGKWPKVLKIIKNICPDAIICKFMGD